MDLVIKDGHLVSGDRANVLVRNGEIAAVGAVVTPVVEGTMGHGASAYSRFADAGGYAGLGTNVVVNAPPDLFEPMRDTLRSHRAHTGTMYPASGIPAAATTGSARAAGLGDVVGTVTIGKRADLILLDGLTHLLGTPALAGAVVTSLGPANIHTVVVDGHVLKRDGRLVALDLARLRAATAELSTHVLGSAPHDDHH